jgi:hypothetical protein
MDPPLTSNHRSPLRVPDEALPRGWVKGPETDICNPLVKDEYLTHRLAVRTRNTEPNELRASRRFAHGHAAWSFEPHFS